MRRHGTRTKGNHLGVHDLSRSVSATDVGLGFASSAGKKRKGLACITEAWIRISGERVFHAPRSYIALDPGAGICASAPPARLRHSVGSPQPAGMWRALFADTRARVLVPVHYCRSQRAESADSLPRGFPFSSLLAPISFSPIRERPAAIDRFEAAPRFAEGLELARHCRPVASVWMRHVDVPDFASGLRLGRRPGIGQFLPG